MARTCLSKNGDYSAAHVMSLGRKENRPDRPRITKRLPNIGDIIIYNIKTPFGDKRTCLKKEQRGCIRITGIFQAIVTGISYQIIPGSEQEIATRITIQKNDFKSGNVLFVKASKTVYCNTYEYDDWMLLDAEKIEDKIARLHPYLQEISKESYQLGMS